MTGSSLGLESLSRRSLFDSLFRNSPSPMILYRGPEFVVEAANAPYYALLSARDVAAVDDASERDLLARVFASGQTIVVRNQLWRVRNPISRAAEDRYFHSTYSPVTDTSGQAYGVFQQTSEVTEQALFQKRLEESEERSRLALEGGKMGIWAFRLPERKLTVDQKSRDLHKIGADEDFDAVIGQRLHPDDVPQIVGAMNRALEHHGLYEVEYRVRAEEGRYRWIYSRGEPIRNATGRVTHLAGVSYDISSRKEAALELEHAKREAELANQTKSAFLANMSHEIRTPLGAILGFASLLEDAEITEETRVSFIKTILRNGVALTRIIDDILDLAKVEAGKLDIETVEFSVANLIEDVVDIFRERTLSKGIYLQTHIDANMPARLVSDPTRLRQILINVVGNAVKFTSRGGIDIRVRPRAESAFEICVADTGIGLTEEQQNKIFEPFVQADNSTTRKFGGTGLGLTLSKRLARALGGDLALRDCKFGFGCEFAITFTAQPPTLGPPRHKDSRGALGAGEEWSGRRILVVDDSEDNQFIVKHLLEKNGLQVDTADNGREAFRKGLAGNYDLIFMDIQMPEMDGCASTRAMREAGVRTPIIALTAHAMAEERARTRAAGCDGHLTKPLVPGALIETLQNFLGSPHH